jgi:hypothetical protein
MQFAFSAQHWAFAAGSLLRAWPTRIPKSHFKTMAGGTAEEFTDFYGNERAKWGRVVKFSGAKVDQGVLRQQP